MGSSWLNSIIERADAALKSSALAEAADLSMEALREDPGSIQAMKIAIPALAKTSRMDEAILLAGRLLQTAPGDEEALNQLATFYWLAGKVPESKAMCERLIEKNSGNAHAWNGMGMCELRGGNLEGAARNFQRAAELAPGTLAFWVNLGGALRELKLPDQAAAAFRKALGLDPKAPHCLRTLSDIESGLNRHNEVIALLRRLEDLETLREEDHILYGYALMDAGEPGGALHHAEAAIGISASSTSAHMLRAAVLQVTGQHEGAQAELEIVIEANPKFALAYYELTQAKKFTLNDRERIAKMGDLAAAPDLPSPDKAVFNLAIGRALDHLGDYGEAMSHLDDANLIFRTIRPKPQPRSVRKSVVDKVIRVFNRSYLHEHTELSSTSELPIFVIGMPRSGTTLIEQVISSHPSAYGAGELTFWRDACEIVLHPSEFFVQAPAAKHFRDEYLLKLKEICPAGSRIVDKHLFNHLLLGFLYILYPKARFVHCLRHPVDNCLSLYSTLFSEPLDFLFDKDEIVFAYREYARLSEHWRQVLPPSSLLEIRYEELVDNQEQTSRRLIEFCGLPWDGACLFPERNQRSVSTSSHWQVRQPMYKSSVERWRRYEPWLGAFQSLIDDPPPTISSTHEK